MKALPICAALALASCAGVEGRLEARLIDPPTDWSIVKGKERNIAWKVPVGDYTMAPPVVSEGLVWIGTGTESFGPSGRSEQAGVLLCVREEDGKLLWRQEFPRRKDLAQEAQAFFSALRGSPLVEGDRLWILNNLWEVVCFDIGPLKRGSGVPRELWKTDLIRVTDSAPSIPLMGFCQTCSIGSSYKGMIYVSTGNGISFKTEKPAKPDAPALLCLDAGTGEVLGRETSGISSRTIESNRSSPVLATTRDSDGVLRTRLLFAGGDGFLYAFDPIPAEDRLLKELWRVDCKSDVGRRNKSDPFGIVSAPAVEGNRVYAILGCDIDYQGGDGALACVDLETGRKLWSFESIGVGATSPLAADGRVYVAETSGIIYCLGGASGKLLWKHDALSTIATPPVLAKGNLYIFDADGEILILEAGPNTSTGIVKTLRPCISYMSTLSLTNGTLYFAHRNQLCAVRQRGVPVDTGTPSEGKRGLAPDALFIPTPMDVVDSMLTLAAVKPTDVLYDLGSGDGRIVIRATSREKCLAVGVELDRVLVQQSREEIQRRELSTRARIEYEDLLKADFGDATVVTLFIGDRLNRLLIPKLQALKPGARIVSHHFPIPGATPDRVYQMTSEEDGQNHALYLYTTPLRISPEGK